MLKVLTIQLLWQHSRTSVGRRWRHVESAEEEKWKWKWGVGGNHLLVLRKSKPGKTYKIDFEVNLAQRRAEWKWNLKNENLSVNFTLSQIIGFGCWNEKKVFLSSPYHPHHSVFWEWMWIDIEHVTALPSHLMLQLVSYRDWAGVFVLISEKIGSLCRWPWYLQHHHHNQILTPLWLAVASTKKIFSTRSSCSRKAISNKSTFTLSLW